MAFPGAPKIAETPLEVLNNPGIGPGLLNIYFTPLATAALGFAAVLVANWASKRPAFSGIQKHIIGLGGGYYAGCLIDKYTEKRSSEKDAVMRHYIQLHPEDFPPFDRKQYKDLLEPWVPIR